MEGFSRYIASAVLIVTCLLLNSCGFNESRKGIETATTEIVVDSLDKEVNSNDCSISRNERPVYNTETGEWFCDKKGISDNH